MKTRAQKADELVRSIDAERAPQMSPEFKEMLEETHEHLSKIISDDKVKPTPKPKKEKTVPTCTRNGCELPRCEESVHCEKHWKSRKKSNANQRLKARTERYEGTRTESELNALVAPLEKRIAHHEEKIRTIREIITRLRGL